MLLRVPAKVGAARAICGAQAFPLARRAFCGQAASRIMSVMASMSALSNENRLPGIAVVAELLRDEAGNA